MKSDPRADLRRMEAMGMLLAKYPLLTMQDIADAASGKAGKLVQEGAVKRLNYRMKKLQFADLFLRKKN